MKGAPRKFGIPNARAIRIMELMGHLTMEHQPTSFEDANPRILIADDQRDVLHALRLLLKMHGFETHEATDPAHAIEAVRKNDFDLVLLDLNYKMDTTSGQEGLDLLAEIRAANPSVPLLVMTAWANTEIAIEAMRRGACDFVLKPWTNDKLLASVEHHARRSMQAKNRERKVAYELEQTLEMFRKFVPGDVMSAPGVDISAFSQNLEAVGGDYFEVVHQADKTAICVGDVIGKGLPAAFLLSSLHASSRPLMKELQPPAQMCSRLNGSICELNLNNRFISFFYCVLDRRTRTLTYSNAGHNPPLLVRSDGSFSQLSNGGRVLGFCEQTYTEEKMELQPGDKLLLFTDGLIEARSPMGEEFGLVRLVDLSVSNRHLSAGDLKRRITESASQFSGARFEDDCTLIVASVETAPA